MRSSIIGISVLGYCVFLFGKVIKCDRIYKIKFVESVDRERESYYGGLILPKDEIHQINTNNLTEDDRMDMCEKARKEVRTREGFYIKFAKKGKTEPMQSYYLHSSDVVSIFSSYTTELVDAYTCPTKPTIYLKVHEDEDKDQVVIVIVPLKDAFSTKSFDSIQYELKCFAGVSEATEDEMMSYADENEIFDDELFTPEECLQMCKVALNTFSHRNNILWLKFGKIGKIKLYKISYDGLVEVAQAFHCPTDPVIYVMIPERVDKKLIAWVVIEKRNNSVTSQAASAHDSQVVTESPRSHVYKLKVVKNIFPAPSRNTFRNPSNGRKNPAVDTDDLSENERREMCRKALNIITGKTVRLLDKDETGLSKLYLIVVAEAQGQNTDIDLNNKRDLIRGFMCPTEPVIHLQVQLDWELSGYSVQVLVRERDLDTALDDTCYRIKFTDSRYAVNGNLETRVRNSKFEVAKVSQCPRGPESYLRVEDYENERVVTVIIRRILPLHDHVRAYELKIVKTIEYVKTRDESEYELRSEVFGRDEKERQKMCHTAAEIVPHEDDYVNWLERVSGSEKFYEIQIEYEERVSREVISAFECPIYPPFYLQTYVDEYFSKSVWVVVKENETEDG